MTNEYLFRVAFWLLLVGLWLMRVMVLRDTHQGAERPRIDYKAIRREGRGLFIGRTIVLFYMMVILVVYAFNPDWLGFLSIPLPDWPRWAGLGLGLISLGLWTWTQVILGKEWSPQLQIQAEHRLVTCGPYAWVRHPMYTAMFGMGVAFAFLTANGGFVIFAVAMIVGFVIRAPREEHMMVEAFGEEYEAYQQRTGRFFPKPEVLFAVLWQR